MREIEELGGHPHILKFLGAGNIKLSGNKVLLMEFIKGGDLFSLIDSDQKIPIPEAKKISRQLLLAISFMHENRIMHRDLKLENILIEKCRDGLFQTLKVCDFGYTRHFPGPEEKSRTLTSCGTHGYSAPEVYRSIYSEKIDLWSFGVVVYCVLHAPLRPYPSFLQGIELEQVMRNFNQYECSAEAEDFLRQCLVVDPKFRLSSEELLKHRWLGENQKPDAFEIEALEEIVLQEEGERIQSCCNIQ